MTSFDVSRNRPPLAGPIVLLLTHRRGGAVLALDPAHLPTQALKGDGFEAFALRAGLSGAELVRPLLAWLWSLQPTVRAIEGPFGLFSTQGAALCLSRTTTAEHLAAMFERATTELGLGSDVAVAVGVGPGSFTGLRIGCAFANGLARGRPRPLWALPCLPLTRAREWVEGLPGAHHWTPEFEVLERGVDESFALVNLVDVMVALGSLEKEEAEAATVLMPVYGKEPGPVLKLRAQEEANQKV